MSVFLRLACLRVNDNVGECDVFLQRQREDGPVIIDGADTVADVISMFPGGCDVIGELLLTALESGAVSMVWIRLVLALSIVAVVWLLHHPSFCWRVNPRS